MGRAAGGWINRTADGSVDTYKQWISDCGVPSECMGCPSYIGCTGTDYC
jgi:hypothetical protein